LSSLLAFIVLIWGQAVGCKGHGHSWLSQRVHGGCLSIAGAKTIRWLFPLVSIVTLPLATLVMAEFLGPLSSAGSSRRCVPIGGEEGEIGRSVPSRDVPTYSTLVYLIIKTPKAKAYLSFTLR